MAEQGSEEWHAKRAGCVTMSGLQAVLDREEFTYADNSANRKLGRAGVTIIKEKKSRRTYRAILALERVNGKPRPNVETWAMREGKEREEKARRVYEYRTGLTVTQTDFLPHHSLLWVGGSPDGLSEDHEGKGGQEIKCAQWDNHAEYIMAVEEGILPDEHKAQVQGNMWNAGADWWDFVPFNPDFAPHLEMGILRVYPDLDYWATLDREVPLFLVEVEELYGKFMRMNGGPVAAPVRLRELEFDEGSREADVVNDLMRVSFPNMPDFNDYFEPDSFIYQRSELHEDGSAYHVFRRMSDGAVEVSRASDEWVNANRIS